MANTKRLTRFVAVPSQDGARLTIEAEDGAIFEVDANFEQLEDLADTLDDILSANDDALEVKDQARA
jgi:hypothetical protein